MTRAACWLALPALALLLSCDSVPRPFTPPQYGLEYTVHVPCMPAESLHVELLVRSWDEGDTVTLLAPPVYADNPFLPRTGRVFGNLVITDSLGERTPFTLDSAAVGLYRSLRVRFAAAALPARVGYDVWFNYDGLGWLPTPFVGVAAGYLQGPFVYLVPWTADSLAQGWRAPADIAVQYRLGPGVSLAGDPQPAAAFANVYQLLFSTCALGGVQLAQGSGGGQAFRFVNLQDTLFAAPTVDSMAAAMTLILDDATPLLGALGRTPLTVILGTGNKGGLEGMHAFSLLSPFPADSHGIFAMVLAHEALHCWLGVRTGEYDDPWWKEGTTEYLGLLVSRRNGLCSRLLVQANLCANLRDSSDVETWPLSSPVVRERLYARDGDMNDLAYTKGAQVCMLMDLAVRRASSGAMDLERITALLCRRYEGSAFRRADFLAAIEQSGGSRLDTLFAAYVDRPGALPDALLFAAYDSLRARGAFGAADVLGKRLAAPAPAPLMLPRHW